MGKRKLTKKQKLSAYKAFEASQIRQMPKKQRQEGAIFQVHVVAMMKNDESNVKGGESFAKMAHDTFGFTCEDLEKFRAGLYKFYTGVVETIKANEKEWKAVDKAEADVEKEIEKRLEEKMKEMEKK